MPIAPKRLGATPTTPRWQQRRVIRRPLHQFSLKVGGASYIVFYLVYLVKRQ